MAYIPLSAYEPGSTPPSNVYSVVIPAHHIGSNHVARNVYHFGAATKKDSLKTQNDNKYYKVKLDVQHYKPDEISVKYVDDHLIVDAKHEERGDEDGFISRGFTKRYKLPNNVNVASIVCLLSSDGVLTIAAMKMVPKSVEMNFKIVQTHQPSVKVETSGKGEPRGRKETEEKKEAEDREKKAGDETEKE